MQGGTSEKNRIATAPKIELWEKNVCNTHIQNRNHKKNREGTEKKYVKKNGQEFPKISGIHQIRIHEKQYRSTEN
jgi:hypothetical protein